MVKRLSTKRAQTSQELYSAVHLLAVVDHRSTSEFHCVVQSRLATFLSIATGDTVALVTAPPDFLN